MTKEEAIKRLKVLRRDFSGYKPNKEMFDMAIKALEQEPTDTWSIKEVADTFKKHGLIREQQPCEDWYDVPSDEMTLEQARQAVNDLRKKVAEYLEKEPSFDAKQKLIKDCKPPTDDWEHYADRLHDIAYQNGYEQAQKDLTCEDAINRQDAIRIAEQGQVQGYEWQFKELIKLPSVTPRQAPCEEREKGEYLFIQDDLINRQAAIDAIPQRIKGSGGESWMMTYRRSGHNDCVNACLDAIRNLPSAQPEKRTDKSTKTHACDCISKQQAINAVCRWGVNNERNGKLMITMAETKQSIVDLLDALPPVTPQPKMGRWIGHREHCENLGVMPSGLGAYEWCSNCDCGIDVREWHRNHYNYCPNCGCRMESEEK